MSVLFRFQPYNQIKLIFSVKKSKKIQLILRKFCQKSGYTYEGDIVQKENHSIIGVVFAVFNFQ